MSLTTASRNVGVALVIATSFPDSAEVTSVIVFAIAQTVLLSAVAVVFGRLTPSAHHS